MYLSLNQIYTPSRAVLPLDRQYYIVNRALISHSIEQGPTNAKLAVRLTKHKRSHTRLGQHLPNASNTASSASPYLPFDALKAPGRKFTAAGWLAALSIAAAIALVLYGLFGARQRKALDSNIQEDAPEADGYESEAYKIVLASVRQNIVFQRALQSMREGNTARAMVELHRVLEHNAVCRKPINLDYYGQTDLEGIYRLHLQNSELPLQYSTLLHLRQILNLSNKKAEQLEGDLKDSAYAFSI